MNDEMDDFSIQAGVKNYFGLIGDHANSVGRASGPFPA